MRIPWRNWSTTRTYVCAKDRFKCTSEYFCLEEDKVCDGNPDCKDGEDEMGCGGELGKLFVCNKFILVISS